MVEVQLLDMNRTLEECEAHAKRAKDRGVEAALKKARQHVLIALFLTRHPAR